VSAGKKLLMQPRKQVATMVPLDLASSFANGGRALPQDL
jgi:hypothetical protein